MAIYIFLVTEALDFLKTNRAAGIWQCRADFGLLLACVFTCGTCAFKHKNMAAVLTNSVCLFLTNLRVCRYSRKWEIGLRPVAVVGVVTGNRAVVSLYVLPAYVTWLCR